MKTRTLVLLSLLCTQAALAQAQFDNPSALVDAVLSGVKEAGGGQSVQSCGDPAVCNGARLSEAAGQQMEGDPSKGAGAADSQLDPRGKYGRPKAGSMSQKAEKYRLEKE